MAAYQRCTVHFYRNVLSKVPKSRRAKVAPMPRISTRRGPARPRRPRRWRMSWNGRGLREVAKEVREGHAETLAYTGFLQEHWRRIRTNNAIERINCEIRRRTRAVDAFPDGRSTLMLVPASPKYVAESELGSVRYLDVSPLDE